MFELDLCALRGQVLELDLCALRGQVRWMQLLALHCAPSDDVAFLVLTLLEVCCAGLPPQVPGCCCCSCCPSLACPRKLPIAVVACNLFRSSWHLT